MTHVFASIAFVWSPNAHVYRNLLAVPLHSPELQALKIYSMARWKSSGDIAHWVIKLCLDRYNYNFILFIGHGLEIWGVIPQKIIS